MKLLVDTHTLLWIHLQPQALGREATKALIHPSSDVHVSVAALWELFLKQGKKGAPLRDPADWWRRFVVGSDIAVLPIRTEHVMQLDGLSAIHHDPFDRILVAQALSEGMTLVSKDTQLRKYGVEVVW